MNIAQLGESDASDDITGGYLLQTDQHQEAYVFHTPKGLPIGLSDPDFSPDAEVPQQTSYISNYVDNADSALFGSSYTNASLGWRAYFDEAAAVNFYIVNDVMGNVDGGDFYSSVYLYKAKDNPLLYMGPVWDFDISSGNVNYQPIVNPTISWMQTQAIWYKQLFTDPGFQADVANQWNALKKNDVLNNWLGSIQQQVTALTQSGQNNFHRCLILGETAWPNTTTQGSYAGEVSYFLNTRSHTDVGLATMPVRDRAKILASVGFEFDIFNNAGEGNNFFGIHNNGDASKINGTDLTPSGLNLHSGDIFHMHMAYDGAALQLTLTHTVTGKRVSSTLAGAIPATLGSNTAYADFTAGTGDYGVTANILTWSYTSN